jgi:hypothetical protein
LVQPLLGLLWRFVLSNVSVLNDGACKQAALGDTERYPFLFTAFFVSTFLTAQATVVLFGYWSEKLTDSAPRWVPSRKALRRIVSVFLLVNSFVFLAALYKNYLVMELKASFNQRLAVLTPKISDQEHKDFLAMWASMTNENDYRHVVDSMEEKAKAGGVALPRILSGAVPSR